MNKPEIQVAELTPISKIAIYIVLFVAIASVVASYEFSTRSLPRFYVVDVHPPQMVQSAEQSGTSEGYLYIKHRQIGRVYRMLGVYDTLYVATNRTYNKGELVDMSNRSTREDILSYSFLMAAASTLIVAVALSKSKH